MTESPSDTPDRYPTTVPDPFDHIIPVEPVRSAKTTDGDQAKLISANVVPLRGDIAKLKSKARSLLEHAIYASDMTTVLDRPYLWKGWLDRGTLAAIYAPPNTGKSFLMLSVSHHIAKGLDLGGRKVRKSRVLYLAAEGGASFANRVAALSEPEFWVLTHGLTLTGPRSDSAPLVELVDHLSATGGKFDLIVIDTLSRVLGEAEEDQKGFNDLVKNLELIIKRTGAAVVLIHHSGKDTLQGMRGSSVLRAAVDTEIQLSRDDETRIITALLTKQRDGPTGYRFAYTLQQVELGLDQDGDPVTTCLVEPVDTASAGHAELTGSARAALDLLHQTLAAEGEVVRKLQYPGGPGIALDRWREACVESRSVSTSENLETRQKAFRRARQELENAKVIVIRDDLVWRVE